MAGITVPIVIIADASSVVTAAGKGGTALKGLESIAKQLGDQLNKVTASTNNVTKATSKGTASFSASKKAAKDLNATHSSLAQTQNFLANAWNNSSQIIDKKYLSSISGLRQGLSRFNQEASRTIVFSKGMTTTLDDASLSHERFRLKADLVTRTMSNMANSMINAGKQAQWTGRQLMVGVTAPILGMAAAADKAGISVAKADLAIRKLLQSEATNGPGGLTAAMSELDDQSKKLSTTLGVTRLDVKSMQETFASGGFTKDQISQLTQITTEFQQLGNISPDKAISMVQVLAKQGYGFDKIRDTLEKLNKMENETALNMNDVVDSFGNIFPIFNQLNTTAPQTIALLAAFKSQGIDVSQGASTLEAAISKLPAALSHLDDGTKDGAARLKYLKSTILDLNKATGAGISFLDPTTGRERPALDMLLQMGAAYETLKKTSTGDAEKIAANLSRSLFGGTKTNEGVTLLDQLGQVMDKDSKSGQDLAKALNIANGAMGSAASRWADQLKAFENDPSTQQQNAINQMVISLQELGKLIIPIATKFFNFLNKVIDKFNGLSEQSKKWILGFLTVIAAIGPVVYIAAQGLISFGVVSKGLIAPLRSLFGLKGRFMDMFDGAEEAGVKLHNLQDEFRKTGDRDKFITETDKLVKKIREQKGATEELTAVTEAQAAAEKEAAAAKGEAAFKSAYGAKAAEAPQLSRIEQLVAPKPAAPHTGNLTMTPLARTAEEQKAARAAAKAKLVDQAVAERTQYDVVTPVGEKYAPKGKVNAAKEIQKKVDAAQKLIEEQGERDAALALANEAVGPLAETEAMAALKADKERLQGIQQRMKAFEATFGVPVPITDPEDFAKFEDTLAKHISTMGTPATTKSVEEITHASGRKSNKLHVNKANASDPLASIRGLIEQHKAGDMGPLNSLLSDVVAEVQGKRPELNEAFLNPGEAHLTDEIGDELRSGKRKLSLPIRANSKRKRKGSKTESKGMALSIRDFMAARAVVEDGGVPLPLDFETLKEVADAVAAGPDLKQTEIIAEKLDSDFEKSMEETHKILEKGGTIAVKGDSAFDKSLNVVGPQGRRGSGARRAERKGRQAGQKASEAMFGLYQKQTGQVDTLMETLDTLIGNAEDGSEGKKALLAARGELKAHSRKLEQSLGSAKAAVASGVMPSAQSVRDFQNASKLIESMKADLPGIIEASGIGLAADSDKGISGSELGTAAKRAMKPLDLSVLDKIDSSAFEGGVMSAVETDPLAKVYQQHLEAEIKREQAIKTRRGGGELTEAKRRQIRNSVYQKIYGRSAETGAQARQRKLEGNNSAVGIGGAVPGADVGHSRTVALNDARNSPVLGLKKLREDAESNLQAMGFVTSVGRGEATGGTPAALAESAKREEAKAAEKEAQILKTFVEKGSKVASFENSPERAFIDAMTKVFGHKSVKEVSAAKEALNATGMAIPTQYKEALISAIWGGEEQGRVGTRKDENGIEQIVSSGYAGKLKESLGDQYSDEHLAMLNRLAAEITGTIPGANPAVAERFAKKAGEIQKSIDLANGGGVVKDLGLTGGSLAKKSGRAGRDNTIDVIKRADQQIADADKEEKEARAEIRRVMKKRRETQASRAEDIAHHEDYEGDIAGKTARRNKILEDVEKKGKVSRSEIGKARYRAAQLAKEQAAAEAERKKLIQELQGLSKFKGGMTDAELEGIIAKAMVPTGEKGGATKGLRDENGEYVRYKEGHEKEGQIVRPAKRATPIKRLDKSKLKALLEGKNAEEIKLLEDAQNEINRLRKGTVTFKSHDTEVTRAMTEKEKTRGLEKVAKSLGLDLTTQDYKDAGLLMEHMERDVIGVGRKKAEEVSKSMDKLVEKLSGADSAVYDASVAIEQHLKESDPMREVAQLDREIEAAKVKRAQISDVYDKRIVTIDKDEEKARKKQANARRKRTVAGRTKKDLLAGGVPTGPVDDIAVMNDAMKQSRTKSGIGKHLIKGLRTDRLVGALSPEMSKALEEIVTMQILPGMTAEGEQVFTDIESIIRRNLPAMSEEMVQEASKKAAVIGKYLMDNTDEAERLFGSELKANQRRAAEEMGKRYSEQTRGPSKKRTTPYDPTVLSATGAAYDGGGAQEAATNARYAEDDTDLAASSRKGSKDVKGLSGDQEIIVKNAEMEVDGKSRALAEVEAKLEAVEAEERAAIKSAHGKRAAQIKKHKDMLMAEAAQAQIELDAAQAQLDAVLVQAVDVMNPATGELEHFASRDEYNKTRKKELASMITEEQVQAELNAEEDAIRAGIVEEAKKKELEAAERARVNAITTKSRVEANKTAINADPYWKRLLTGSKKKVKVGQEEEALLEEMHARDSMAGTSYKKYSRKDINKYRKFQKNKAMENAFNIMAGGGNILDEVGEDETALPRGRKARRVAQGKKTGVKGIVQDIGKVGKEAEKLTVGATKKGGGSLLDAATWFNPLKGIRAMGEGLGKNGLLGHLGSLVSESPMLNAIFPGMAEGLGGVVAASGPFIIIIAAIAGAVAILAANFDKWIKFAQPGIDKLKNAFAKIKDAVLEPVIGLFEKLGGSGTKAGKGVGSMWENIGKIIGKVAEIVAKVLTFIAPILKFIITSVVDQLYIFIEIFRAVIALVTGNWSDFGDALMEIWDTTWNYIKMLVGSSFKAIITVIGSSISNIITGIRNLVNHLPKSFLGMSTGVQGLVDALDAASGAVDSLRDNANKGIDDIFGLNESHSKDDAKKTGEDMNQAVQDGLADKPIDAPPIDPQSAQDAVNKFISAFQNQLQKVVDGWKDAALKAFDDWAKAGQDAIDTQIDAIDKVAKAEQERDQDQEYLLKKEEMRQRRRSEGIKYHTDRDLAIYEGRYDDAKQLDYQYSQTLADLQKEEADVDKSRQQQLTDRARDAEKERLNIEKDALQKSNELRRSQLEEQLNMMTEYIPKNVAEAQAMHEAIQAKMSEFTDGYGVIGTQQASEWGKGWTDAFAAAQKQVSEEAFWAGADAMNQFATALGIDPASLAAANAAPSAPTDSGGNGMNSKGQLTHPGDSTGDPGNGLSTGGQLTHRHSGGSIGNTSMAPADVPATLQTGEYVVRRSAVAKLGMDYMDQINKGQTPTFHEGGMVGIAHQAMSQKFEQAKNQFMTGGLTLGQFRGPDGTLQGGFSADTIKNLYQQAASGFMGDIGEARQAIINFAMSKLGLPYQWGGTGPLYDCSGLVQAAYEAAGIYLPRVDSAQHDAGVEVDNPVPADLTWHPGHVGIYLGNGKMIDAPHTGANIRVEDVWGDMKYVRIPALGSAAGSSASAGSGVKLKDAVRNAISGGGTSTFSGGDAQLKEMVQQSMLSYGWDTSQWNPLDQLIGHESGWNPNATNPSSGAWGLFQFMPMHFKPGGALPNGTSSTIAEQISAGLNYISGRYGQPSSAWDFWQRTDPRPYAGHWYHKGGMVFPNLPSLDTGGFITADGIAKVHSGERVLNRAETASLGGGDSNEFHMHFEGGFFGSDRELEKLANTMETRILPKIQRVRGQKTRKFSKVTK